MDSIRHAKKIFDLKCLDDTSAEKSREQNNSPDFHMSTKRGVTALTGD